MGKDALELREPPTELRGLEVLTDQTGPRNSLGGPGSQTPPQPKIPLFCLEI